MHEIKQQVLFMQRYSIYIKNTNFRYKYYNLHHVFLRKTSENGENPITFTL